jgi:outer membrane protein assembly factor BamD (BamD/ComL family)
LLPGQDWRVEIPRAVREADVVVICLSNKSITKEGYVQREIKFALDSADEKPEDTIFLIPARLEECVVPEQLGRWQWVDLFEENGFIRLLRSLKLRANRIGATVEPAGYESEDQETEHRLDQLYTEGLAAFYTEDWDRAYQRFQSILRERPNHKNAAEKLAQAERQKILAKLYAQAAEALQSENWKAAIQTLEELLGKSGDYKDSVQLLADAKKRHQLKELYAEAKRLHAAQKWQAVLKVFEQISIIEPTYPDPEELLASAQREAAELKRLNELNTLYGQGIRKMDTGEWYEARSLLEQVHKAQTGFLDTERLLRKIEDEILRIEEGRKRNAQVQMLYEQVRKMTRTGQWGKALAQMEEIRKLDKQFVDSDGIIEKSKAGLEREEQEAQQRRELSALYAEAVSLLEAKKYQEALEKWNAIQAIDPKYRDTSRVKTIARRKLDEISRPETVGGPWAKITSDWFRLEANIPVEREILTEKWLLFSFAVIVIIYVLWDVIRIWLNIWETVPIVIFLYWCLQGGLYGTVVAFVLNKTNDNWRLRHSLTLVIGWTLGFGIALTPVVSWVLPPIGDSFYWFTALSIVVAIKWAQPSTKPISLIVIFVSWVLAWKTGYILGVNLESIYNPTYTWALANALSILLGLLFTFGIQIEESWDVLKTAIIGALGFAAGNYIVTFPLASLSLSPEISFALWGLIGGAILEAPSRDSRRILFSAGLCGIGLLVGSYVALVIVPKVTGPSYIFPERYAILKQIFLGIGLGLAFGLSIRRALAIGVQAVLGAGIYMFTRGNIELLGLLGVWGNIVRGALIGMVLGYGYGYMRKSKPQQNKSGPVIAKPNMIGIVGIVIIVIMIISINLFGSSAASPILGKFTVTALPETCPTYPLGTDFESFVSEADDRLAPWSGTSVHFVGTDECTGRETLGDASLIYRYKLEFAGVTRLISIAVSGAAFNRPGVIRVLDANMSVLRSVNTFGGNSFRTHYVVLQGVDGTVFYVEEFDTSSAWRFRQDIVVNGHVP